MGERQWGTRERKARKENSVFREILEYQGEMVGLAASVWSGLKDRRVRQEWWGQRVWRENQENRVYQDHQDPENQDYQVHLVLDLKATRGSQGKMANQEILVPEGQGELKERREILVRCVLWWIRALGRVT